MHRATRPARPHLWTIVLAAGSSSRLGTAKQLVRIRQRSLLMRAIDAAEVHTPGRVIVVLGAATSRLRGHLRRHARSLTIVQNSRWQQGMGHSLSTAARALPPNAEAVLVLLADQPRVDAAALARLVEASRKRPNRIAASAYTGRVGVPAIFPRAELRALRRIDGDTGAREVLRARSDVQAVETPEAAFDVDLPEDLDRL